MDKKIISIYMGNPDNINHAELELPATPWEMVDAMDKLRLSEGQEPYWQVEDMGRYEFLAPHLDGYDLYQFNALAEKLRTFSDVDAVAFEGLVQMELNNLYQNNGGELTLRRVLNLAYSVDCCHVVPGITDDAALGQFYVENDFLPDLATVPDSVLEMLDYLDIYSGNTKKRLSMYEALEKLKKDVGDRNTIHFGGTSCARLYEIKRLAITQYFFYYNNHILYQGFRDLKDFFKPYIEAIICANSDAAQKTTLFGDMEFANEKYAVEYIDLDIMAKFISTKDLSALVRSYNVKQLNTGVQEVTFLAECFKNLCHSIVTAKTYGLLQSSFSALSNIVLLLNLVVLDENSKEIIAASVEALLSDKIIAPIFFSIGWPDFRQSLRELSKLCSLLAFPHNFEFVHQIVGGEKFFEYAVNVHFNSLRHLIEQFISKDEATTDKIQAIIDTTEDFHKKVILLRLFYQQITGDTVQQKYKYILSDNFAQLPIEAIYDFIFSGWLTPDQNSIKEFLNGVIELSRKEVTGVHSYPDPVESRLECVYLLYINDMISDISALKELSEGRPHLQFLLDSESFDYSQVDFSNYMWENFARHEKYMSCFIAHKDAIIPIIQNRIKSEEASETEKRILYGFLLSGNEIWKI